MHMINSFVTKLARYKNIYAPNTDEGQRYIVVLIRTINVCITKLKNILMIRSTTDLIELVSHAPLRIFNLTD